MRSIKIGGGDAALMVFRSAESPVAGLRVLLFYLKKYFSYLQIKIQIYLFEPAISIPAYNFIYF